MEPDTIGPCTPRACLLTSLPPSPLSGPQSSSRLAWLLLGLAAAIVIVWFVHALGYWEDDAWIHLVFARSLAAGQGFAVHGSIVYGDTSPLWVWLLVAMHAVIPSWMAAGKTLSVLGALFALTGFFVLAHSLVVDRLGVAPARVFAATMVLFLVVNPYFGYWAFSGMEALAAAGLACFGVWVVNRRDMTPAALLTGCLVGGLAPLLRPEMGFFTVLLGLVLAWRLWTMRASLSTRVILFCSGTALLLVPFGLWARYAVRTFGSVLPTTNAAKRANPDDSVVTHLAGMYLGGFPIAVAALILILVWIITRRVTRRRHGRPKPRLALPAGTWLILTWSAITFLFYVADHTYVQTRYLLVTAPVLTLVLLAAVAVTSGRWYRLLLAAGLLAAIVVSVLCAWPSVTNKVLIVRDVALLSDEIRTLPPDAVVADYSIGEVAFLSGHPILDTGGILRPDAIPYLFQKSETPRLAWAQAQGAQYVVEWDTKTSRGTIIWEHDFPVSGWYFNPRRYAQRVKLVLWKLPPAGPAQTASTP